MNKDTQDIGQLGITLLLDKEEAKKNNKTYKKAKKFFRINELL